MGGKNSKPSQVNDSKETTTITSSPSKQTIKANDAKSTALTTYQGPPLGEAWDDSVLFLPRELKGLINGYHAGHFDTSRYTPNHCQSFRLFGRNAIPAYIGTRALDGRRTQALSAAAQNLDSLELEVLVSDPFGRQAYGTPLRLAAAAGNHLLVRGLRGLLPEQKAHAQLNAHFPPGWEIETKDRMEQRYLTPLRRFAGQLAEAKLSAKGVRTFDQAKAECKDIIHEYRVAIRPKPNDPIITTGLMFDPQVYPSAYQFILTQIDSIGGWSSFETDLIFGVGYQSLLGAGHAFIAQITICGANKYFDKNITPAEDLNFSNGSAFYSVDPDIGIGVSFVVSYFGDIYGSVVGRRACVLGGVGILCRARTSILQSLCNCRTIH